MHFAQTTRRTIARNEREDHLSGFHVVYDEDAVVLPSHDNATSSDQSSDRRSCAWQIHDRARLPNPRGRHSHASLVVVVPPAAAAAAATTTTTSITTSSSDNDLLTRQQKTYYLVVLGGHYCWSEGNLDSVLIWNLSSTTTATKTRTTSWQCGPGLIEMRVDLKAVYCNQHVYVIGGCKGLGDALDSVECIAVSDLISEQHQANKHQNSGWTTLPIRLSRPRTACCAVAVQDRFIVVMGGFNVEDGDLSSVDIIDTMSIIASSTAGTTVTIFPGPCLCKPRIEVTAAVVDNRIWVVDEYYDEDEQSCSVAYLELPSFITTGKTITTDATTTKASTKVDSISSLFSSAVWNVHPNLKLRQLRERYCMTSLGGCLIIAGGMDMNGKPIGTVEVMDVYRQVVWTLEQPFSLQIPRFSASLVSVKDMSMSVSRLFLIGGSIGVYQPEDLDSIESLSMFELSLSALSKYERDNNIPDKSEACLVKRTKKKRRQYYHTLLYYLLLKQGVQQLTTRS